MVDTAMISPNNGGVLQIREAGLQVRFPKGAVTVPTRVWVKAYGGNKVVYEFGPHGTQFLAPITVQQDLRETKAWGDDRLQHELFGGYTPNTATDISADGTTVDVAETFGVDLVPDNKKSARYARFYTTHFSGYVLASGRTAYRAY
jgi:hypothetical protein